MKFQLESSKPRIFPSTSSPSTGWKFSFLVLPEPIVGSTFPSITVTSFVSQADLIAVIDDGSKADSGGGSQITSNHIGCESDGGVIAARGVAK